MSTQAMSLFCHRCRMETGHTKTGTNHVLHLLLTLVSFGIWFVPWMIIWAINTGPARCSHCGGAYDQRLAAQSRARLMGGPPPPAAPIAPSSPPMKRCPYCAEEIRVEAIRCKHCAANLDAPLR